MNHTQIVQAAARELAFFSFNERTTANAKIELLKLTEITSDQQAKRDIEQNLDFYAARVLRIAQ